MYYAPHILRFRHPAILDKDEFGRPVKGASSEWEDGGECRCDDNTIQEFTDDNGRVYRPTYKVVIEGKTEVRAGDEIEVYMRNDTDVLRGKGKVYNVVACNYLSYSVVWV